MEISEERYLIQLEISNLALDCIIDIVNFNNLPIEIADRIRQFQKDAVPYQKKLDEGLKKSMDKLKFVVGCFAAGAAFICFIGALMCLSGGMLYLAAMLFNYCFGTAIPLKGAFIFGMFLPMIRQLLFGNTTTVKVRD